MFLTEYDEKKVLETEREEGQIVKRERVATDMIIEGGVSVSYIARMSKLSEDTVRNLAKSLGIAVS